MASAAPRIRPILVLWNQLMTMTATTRDQIRLFIMLTRISLYINILELPGPTCPRASPQIMIISAWLLAG